MNRLAIPAEIRREVLVEAGHRCAIPTCKYPCVDVHHIIPWERCNSHDFDNLIALCPNCHRRADNGEIDRKALRLYKSKLSAAIGSVAGETARSEYEIGCLAESQEGKPGYEFEFEYPVFVNSNLKPVSRTLEAWGYKLLQEHRSDHRLSDPYEFELMSGPNTTSASFKLIRNDDQILSIKYRVICYGSGAAHAVGYSVTHTYFRQPLFLVCLEDIFSEEIRYLDILSDLSRAELIKNAERDKEWMHRGTEPNKKNFRAFNITPNGLLLTFDAYQVDCFAAGPQVIEISYAQLASESLISRRFPDVWSQQAP